jgi:hypothetical protein
LVVVVAVVVVTVVASALVALLVDISLRSRRLVRAGEERASSKKRLPTWYNKCIFAY